MPLRGQQRCRSYLAAACALTGVGERAAAELAEARRMSPDDRYSSIAEDCRTFWGAKDPSLARSHLFCRPAQGRDTGGVTPPSRRLWLGG
jgi:hypothetical protein